MIKWDDQEGLLTKNHKTGAYEHFKPVLLLQDGQYQWEQLKQPQPIDLKDPLNSTLRQLNIQELNKQEAILNHSLAIKDMAHLTGGYLRLINSLCLHADLARHDKTNRNTGVGEPIFADMLEEYLIFLAENEPAQKLHSARKDLHAAAQSLTMPETQRAIEKHFNLETAKGNGSLQRMDGLKEFNIADRNRTKIAEDVTDRERLLQAAHAAFLSPKIGLKMVDSFDVFIQEFERERGIEYFSLANDNDDLSFSR